MPDTDKPHSQAEFRLAPGLHWRFTEDLISLVASTIAPYRLTQPGDWRAGLPPGCSKRQGAAHMGRPLSFVRQPDGLIGAPERLERLAVRTLP